MRKIVLCLTAAAALGGCTSEWDSAKTGAVPTISPQNSAPDRLAARIPAKSAAERASDARLPDKGDLVVYDRSRPVFKRAAFSYHSIGLSEAHALNAAHPGGEVDIQTPSGKSLSFAYQRHVEHGDGNWTWVGRTREGLDAVITFGPDAVYGRIAQPNTESLQLTYSNGRTWLVEADPTKLRHPGSRLPMDHDVAVVPRAALAALRNQNAAKTAAKGAIAANAVAAATGPSNTIDVVLGYTPGLVSQNGGSTSAVVTLLTNRIELTNQALASSLVSPRVRLVHTLQVNYTDTTTNSAALDSLSGQTCTPTSCSSVPVPAELQPLRNARETYGGDIVSLVRPLKEPEHNGCGIAWLLGPNNTTIDNTDAPFAYSVVSNGSDVRESDGFTYSCPVETLAHEMAHNMGQQHNVEDSGGDAGTHPYSYGFRETATNGFYTIMAYPLASSGQFSIPYFGNPNVNYLAGRPTGSANADNARSMNQSMLLVAQFRNTVVPFNNKAIPNDYDSDGRSDIYWRNSATGMNDIWFMNGANLASASSVILVSDLNWKVIGSGDFNNDLAADTLWRNSATGELFIRYMQGTSILPTSGPSLTVANQAWTIVALGDFNNDGVTDIYWRNTTNGKNDLWLMSASSRIPQTATTVYTEADQNWKIAGTGDFNADGNADVFWRNSVTGGNYVQLMNGLSVLAGSGFTNAVSDTNWKIVAIRDFDRDGRSDIYWRHAQTGSNYLWTMNGITVSTVSFVHNEPDQAWKIVNSGDYNGDGYGDVLWRNTTTGQNVIHLMQGASVIAGSAQFNRVADLNWVITGITGSN